MQEKDIAEKEFVSHNDVFADIVNGFLFHGRQVVDPDDLGPASCRGYYIEKGKLHETVRDVARTVEKSGLVVSLVGIENQSASDRYMPIRVGCYDFSSYRSQLGRKPPQRVCPAVTLVPYYGMTRWPYPTRLSELLDVPVAWRPFVEDWRMANLCQVAFLEPEQVGWFRSDFRHAADFFVQRRLTGEYKPSGNGSVRHVEDTMRLLSRLTGDRRFEEAGNELLPWIADGGGVSMCEVLDKIENRGIQKGLEQGVESVAMKMVRLGVPEDNIEAYTGLTGAQVRALRAKMVRDSR